MKKLFAFLLAMCMLLPVLASAELATPTDLCAHEHTSIIQHTNYRANGSDSYHDAYYLVETVCDDCGETLDSREELLPDTDFPHEFGPDGTCICGYVNPCTHPDTWEGIEWDESVSFTAVDNATHTASGLGYSFTQCALCNQLLYRDETPTNRTREEGHTYDENGVCMLCGHVNTCTHPNANTSEWIDDPNTVYTAVDNRYHTATGKGYRATYCDDCYQQLDYAEVDQLTTKDQHSYDSNGVCVYCNHKNTCTHESANPDWWFTDEEKLIYTSVDDQSHKITGPAHVYTYCKDCGIELDNHDEESKTTIVNHDYNTDGVCTLCGHKTACTHPDYWYNKKFETYTVQDNKDGKSHTTTWSGELQTVCSVCHAPLSSTPVSNDTFVSEHLFGEDGKCFDCDYTRSEVCAHPSTETIRYVDNSKPFTCESVDAYSHKFTGSIVTDTYCSECGLVLKTKVADDSYTAQHEFIDGVCTGCGYRNTCAHEHTRTEQYIAYVDEVISTTATTHTVKGLIRTSVWCEDCYETVSFTDEKGATMTGNHNFHNNVCSDCGYVSACAHTNKGEKVDLDTRLDTYTPVDAKNHRISGPGWISKVCLDCGQVFSTEETDNCEKLEAHTMVNGTCSLCGYTEPAKEPETPATDEPETPATDEPETPADDGDIAPEEAASDEEIIKEAKSNLDEAVAENTTVEVTTDETTGCKTVTIAPKEDAADGTVALKATPESMKKLAEQNVTVISVESTDGKAGLSMDVPAIAKEMEANPGAELIIEMDSAPTLDEKVAETLTEKYEIMEDAMLSVIRVALKNEDGSEVELDSAIFTLKVNLDYVEGMKFIYLDEEGVVSEIEAVFVEATETVPAHWELPYMGNGTYLPVVPKAE